MFNFERLEVWQKAVAFAGLVYRLSQKFPSDERFDLSNQIRHAATSIASNIAEGSALPPADFAKFIGYASRSLYEVLTQATLAGTKAFSSSSFSTNSTAPLMKSVACSAACGNRWSRLALALNSQHSTLNPSTS